MAVHVRSVGGLEVANRYSFARAPHFSVLTRNVGVVHDDFDVRAAPDDQGQVGNSEGTTVAHNQARLTLAPQKVGLHLDGTGLEVVVNEDLNLDRAHEDVALTECVLPDGFLELTD